jgi:hypothetical protein
MGNKHDKPAPASLEQRVAIALTCSIAATAIVALIAEVEGAIATMDETISIERAKALDLVASPDSIAAREQLIALEFSRDRVKAALPKLQNQHKEVAALEYNAAWNKRLAVVEKERAVVAAALAEFCPQMASKLIALLAQVRATDQRLSEVWQASPSGAGGDRRKTELFARDMAGYSRDVPEIAQELMLPPWRAGEASWPPRGRYVAPLMIFGGGAPGGPYSADWAAHRQQRAEAEKRANDAVFDHYERQEASRLERENAATEQRLAERQRA